MLSWPVDGQKRAFTLIFEGRDDFSSRKEERTFVRPHWPVEWLVVQWTQEGLGGMDRGNWWQ